jgi:ATP-binding cassette subfamily B protein
MSKRSSDSNTGPAELPANWRHALAEHLLAEETVVAWLPTDLNTQLRYADGAMVLTDQRLLTKEGADADWQVWPVDPGLKMHHHDHAGVGTLELHDAHGRRGIWRYTLKHNVAAIHLEESFNRLR